ncbi:MAG: hypothetical protein QOJ19_4756, partial [Acidimicrobiia bacterium]|nr:hypothetical protein [Acidimicrobiia bacterium]
TRSLRDNKTTPRSDFNSERDILMFPRA